jgi:enediyne biosynthesis protein E4
LNERRFGWGAAMGDLNLDGWLDIVQANGMVDDAIDKKFP